MKQDNGKKRNFWFKFLLVLAGVLIIPMLLITFIIFFIYIPTKSAELPVRNIQKDVRVVHVNGFDLWYKETGNDLGNSPIVVLHGGPGMSCNYFKDAFKFLEKTHRVIYYDQRGSGFSQIKKDMNLYNMDTLVSELDEIRKNVLKTDKIILIGHSYGGMLAMRYSIEHEANVEKMILVSPVPGWRSFTASVLIVLYQIAHHGLPPEDPAEADIWFKNACTLFRSSFYNRDNFNMLDPGYISFGTMTAIQLQLHGKDYRDELKKIKTDTLIVYGDSEMYLTEENEQIKLHNSIPNSKIVKFNKSGHWSFLEEPDRFKQVVGDFITVIP